MQMLFLFFLNVLQLNYSNICNIFRRYLCHLRIITIEYLYIVYGRLIPINPPFSRVLGLGWVLGNPTQTYIQITQISG